MHFLAGLFHIKPSQLWYSRKLAAQASKLVCFNSPCSPRRDAYSLDEGQDTLEEEDEEEGHEVERAISPTNIVKKREHKR